MAGMGAGKGKKGNLTMSDLYTRKPVPIWRIVLYGILAATGVAALGYYQNDHRLYIAAVFCGVFIGGVGFLLSWAGSNIKIEPIPGQPSPYATGDQVKKRLFILGIAAIAVFGIYRVGLLFPELGLNLIKSSPFIGAICIIIKAIRVVMKGEVETGRYFHRTVFKSSNPVRFWMEICLYFIVAAFLVLISLQFYGYAPHWFKQLMSDHHKLRHSGR